MPARFRRRAQTEGDTYSDQGSESEAWSLRGVTGTCLKLCVVTGQAVAPSRHEFWALQAPPIKPKYGTQRTPYAVNTGSLGAGQTAQLA